ncbi:LOW QUALITY PROTEIN: protein RETICULATA-RELATED 3, chloroplastic-like [Actinidia eriantha]|uniref:LOW QUALITY PROTEIN: protein RETICULATA-RELATED 3, chloroplastic-like n=1 Tax=Actinidia eriantha TaxID=165200 RepID=UPI00258ADB88|nr:LOW QUALITY PROTEIN: protein RETICULATA-RELATED 3, chloroplastic-like [Actinidia eriantha]
MTTASARLLQFSLSRNHSDRHLSDQSPSFSFVSFPRSSSPLRTQPKFQFSCAGAGGSAAVGRGSGGSSGGGGGSGGWSEGKNSDDDSSWVGPIGAFLNGWRSRVAADPQFPFKVLMEELVGVSACVLGDMASRPNFGLNELDFVFSTLVVGCILNFVLMYLLAPTMSASGQTLPSIFANCPTSHMFEPGPFGLHHRLGTFIYKGVLFAAVGFAAGLVGTAISNGLIMMRKKMDPSFETPNKAPPTILNAATWAIHMGVSSNLRYQTLNGAEFLLANVLPPVGFKSSVVVMRCLNNVLGGMSFVVLARLTGSQSVDEGKMVAEEAASVAEKEKLIGGSDDSSSNQSN